MEGPPEKKKPELLSTRYVPVLFIGTNNDKTYFFASGIIAEEIQCESAKVCPSLSVDSLCDYKIESYSNDTEECSFVPQSVDRVGLIKRSSPIASEEEYITYILRPLVLGSRALEHNFTSAIVTEVHDDGTVKVNLTSPPFSPSESVLLRTESGNVLDDVIVEETSHTSATLRARSGKLPSSIITPDTRLHIISKGAPCVVTSILPLFYAACPIENWPLLKRIYGDPEDTVGGYSPDSKITTTIHLEGTDMTLVLNDGQNEALGRYHSTSPAFVVEGPTGSGKTTIAAAMAVSFKADGLQLLLSTTDEAVLNIAHALKRLDNGDLEIVHITDDIDSPFSKHDYEDKRNQKYDVVLATVDVILRRSANDALQEQLRSSVEKVVIDEANRLSEAALNAIILCFPRAQIVLIGDSSLHSAHSLGGQKDETSKCHQAATGLASQSAIDALKRRGNIPVVNLRMVYRVSASMIQKVINIDGLASVSH